MLGQVLGMSTPNFSLCYNHFAHYATPCIPSLHGSCAVALDAQRQDGALLDAWRFRGCGSLGVAISVGAFPTTLDRGNRAAAIALQLVTSGKHAVQTLRA